MRQIKKELRESIYERDRLICRYCGVQCVRPKETRIGAPNSAAIDHVIPRRQGGLTEPDNLVVACWTCNSRKHNRTPAQFVDWHLDRWDWDDTRL